MKLQEYNQLVAGKLGIRQDTVKQQRGLIRWMINNNTNDPNHGITIKTLSGILFGWCRAWFHGGVALRYKPPDGWTDDGQPADIAGLKNTYVESVDGRSACLDCVDFRLGVLVVAV
ncbi:MAG: hypothetical protein EF813_05795 [Methanosarcinales archaeon]|nr:MAG: hypothetical protein EF813_05795 [Methanosarcinales archaeon]